MTSEQRFNRLERIVKLMIKAGLRARRQLRAQDEKVNMIINFQIHNEERFQQTEQRFQQTEQRFQQNEQRFARLAEAQITLAHAQANTSRRLDDLIEIIRRGRNGNPQTSP